MAHAERCPVCDTEGVVDNKPCHGCNGKGWIEVQNNISPYISPYTSFGYAQMPDVTYVWTSDGDVLVEPLDAMTVVYH